MLEPRSESVNNTQFDRHTAEGALHNARVLIDVAFNAIESEVEDAGVKARLVVLLDSIDANLRAVEKQFDDVDTAVRQ